jgi:hypothetical protein
MRIALAFAGKGKDLGGWQGRGPPRLRLLDLFLALGRDLFFAFLECVCRAVAFASLFGRTGLAGWLAGWLERLESRSNIAISLPHADHGWTRPTRQRLADSRLSTERRNQHPGPPTRGWQPSKSRFCYCRAISSPRPLVGCQSGIFGVIGSTEARPRSSFFCVVSTPV